MRLAIMATLAGLTIPAMLTAQAHPLVGTWDLTYAAGMQVTNGVATPIEATAAFTVTAEGDSLVAVLERPPIEGMPDRPPARFATKASDNWPIIFEQRSEAHINVGGSMETRTAVSIWRLTVTDGRIEGTVERSIEGMEMPVAGPQPVSGVRKR